MTSWVRQEDAGGCGAATLAMIVGCTYAEAKEKIDALVWISFADETPELKPIKWSDGEGMSSYSLDRVLYAHGFYKQTHSAAWGHDLTVPFAPIHYAQVVQPSNNHHFVVMLEDGDVLDPLREGRFRLSDWPKVNQVCGLVSATDALLERPDPIEDPLPDDLERLLRDPEIVLPVDEAVFDLAADIARANPDRRVPSAAFLHLYAAYRHLRDEREAEAA